ncbi:MAG: isoprenylcysteine carboxylmethyltransferase family protein [Chitinophagaceae bacterium]
MKVFILMVLTVVIIHSFFNSLYSFLAPFNYPEVRNLKIIGFVLGHLSIIGIVIAQLQMKQSRGIGIDYENKTQLITTGFFKLSRNPIYLLLLISLTGLFLIVPNAVTFAVLFAAWLILHVTMRLEEEFLEKQHGEAYLQYKHKIRRLL